MLREVFIKVLHEYICLLVEGDLGILGLLHGEYNGVPVDDIVVLLLQALLRILLLVERDVPVAKSLARLPVQHYLRFQNRIALTLEHLVQVQIVEGILGNVPNVDAGTKTLVLLLLIVSAALSIVKVEVLEALDQLFSID